MTKEILKKNKIPDSPGVYFFLKGREILYIGKATSLRDRIKSYFGKNLMETRGQLIVDLVFKADKVNWQKTDSVLEALILETTLIKKYQPKYNTKEKSDKSFNYVCITKDKKIAVVRGKILNKEKYDSFFGPFPDGNQLREALKIVRKIFPYLDDRKGTKGGDEFYRQIRLVPENFIEKKNNIKNIKLLFKGKKKKILGNLKKEMKEYAKNREFEKAAEIKRQIFALQHINDVALIKSNSGADNKIFGPAPFFGRIKGTKAGPSDAKILLSAPLFRIEAYDIAHMSGKNMVGVMVVVENGEAKKSEYKKFRVRTQEDANDTGALKEILERRFNHKEWKYPDFVVVDGGIAQINIAKTVLAEIGLKIKVVSVLKDERHKPKNIIGSKEIVEKHKKEILLANNEAHRFAITYHKKLRNKNFLK